ncbi:glycerol-3-phosphate dehydrogenase [Aestuariivirga sp.]|uniref:glycerol-3-phosphate dehydrogenase n=1 Tax=Aestuariivirga sp. TaxID=2650926 RepID=UPI003918E447
MTYDLFIIGGGVNGCGIARDAAGRGLSVFLAEQGDLASGTSSASTKLIHGGLRYLEHYEFRLVREALIEREVLLRAAPHIIWPLRFVLPHHKGLRPWPVLRLGLFLYDHLGGRRILPGTRSVDLRRDVTGEPLKPDFTRGYEYSDCWVEDSRLVVLNARDAQAKGAVIRTRTKCSSARRVEGGWELTVTGDGGIEEKVRARVLVNAAGPWVSQVLGSVVGRNDPDRIRMVKGSHLVVERLYDHDRCYIFQNADGRICFAIPYEQDYTLIGTTDEDHKGEPGKPEISEAETDYLLAAVSEYFRKPVTRDMVRWAYSGIRPLYDDGASKAQEATRDYVLKLDHPEGGAPLLSVFGGKITTFRKLAESALEKVAAFFPQMGKPWTASAALPGGDFAYAEVEQRISVLSRDYPFLDQRNLRRLFRAYGTDAERILAGARSAADLGRSFGPLSEREVDWLREREWARTAEDILWRRSKLGLHLNDQEQDALRAHMAPSPEAKEMKRAGG